MIMGLLRPPGFAAFANIKSWLVRTINSRISRVDPPNQAPHQSVAPATVSRPFSSTVARRVHPRIQPVHVRPSQSRGIQTFRIPRFARPPPNYAKPRILPSTYFFRPTIGAFPRNPWSSGISRFHTSPATSAVALTQIAHSVSQALKTGIHPRPPPLKGQILAQVAARAACQIQDGPAGYIRFTISPPTWTPVDTDVSDPDLVNAIDTHIAELKRVKSAILKLRQYGDFPVRGRISEANIDVLFRGASAEDVKRWNKNEFKLTSGRVGADQVFCAGRFEDFVQWSEVLDAERKVEKEMAAKAGDGGLLKFWEELKFMEGRIR